MESSSDFDKFTIIEDKIENKNLIEFVRNLTDDKNKKIMDMIIDGYSYFEIGKSLGISKQAICNRLKYLGKKISELYGYDL